MKLVMSVRKLMNEKNNVYILLNFSWDHIKAYVGLEIS